MDLGFWMFITTLSLYISKLMQGRFREVGRGVLSKNNGAWCNNKLEKPGRWRVPRTVSEPTK